MTLVQHPRTGEYGPVHLNGFDPRKRLAVPIGLRKQGEAVRRQTLRDELARLERYARGKKLGVSLSSLKTVLRTVVDAAVDQGLQRGVVAAPVYDVTHPILVSWCNRRGRCDLGGKTVQRALKVLNEARLIVYKAGKYTRASIVGVPGLLRVVGLKMHRVIESWLARHHLHPWFRRVLFALRAGVRLEDVLHQEELHAPREGEPPIAEQHLTPEERAAAEEHQVHELRAAYAARQAQVAAAADVREKQQRADAGAVVCSCTVGGPPSTEHQGSCQARLTHRTEAEELAAEQGFAVCRSNLARPVSAREGRAEASPPRDWGEAMKSGVAALGAAVRPLARRLYGDKLSTYGAGPQSVSSDRNTSLLARREPQGGAPAQRAHAFFGASPPDDGAGSTPAPSSSTSSTTRGQGLHLRGGGSGAPWPASTTAGGRQQSNDDEEQGGGL